MTRLEHENILGYQVVNSGCCACLDSILYWLKHGKTCRWLGTINPHSYVIARDNDDLSQALHSVDWLVPDGFGIVLASRWHHGAITERVTGSDIFWNLNKKLNEGSGWRMFFLGSTSETLDKIKMRMARDYPNIVFAGSYSPPFKDSFTDDENEHLLCAINDAQPDVLWVGMTAPKQEIWLYRHKERLNVKFAAAVGAVFDFYAGNVQRSHPKIQNLGLEWLTRLFREPRRLWKRMFISAPIFIWHVLRDKR